LFSHFFENYADYEYGLASAQLLFAMLGMGAVLAPRDFAEVFRRPRVLLLGLALQLIGAPLIAAILSNTLPIPAGIAAGLALVAAVPGGTFSNIVTYMARGNIALSISLTAVTTLACLATTPILLRLVAGVHLPTDFVMPVGDIALQIGIILLVPLFVGMYLGMRFPSRRELISNWSIRTSVALIGALIVGSAGAGRLDPTAYGLIGPVAGIALAGGLQALAFAVTALAGLRIQDRVAIGIEVTIRNSNLAVMVKALIFPAVTGVADPIGDGMFFIALLYGGLALPVAMIPLAIGRRAGAKRSL